MTRRRYLPLHIPVGETLSSVVDFKLFDQFTVQTDSNFLGTKITVVPSAREDLATAPWTGAASMEMAASASGVTGPLDASMATVRGFSGFKLEVETAPTDVAGTVLSLTLTVRI